MSRAATKPVNLCLVTLQHIDLLMPADKGLKLIELLQHAQLAHWDFNDMSGNRKYIIGSTVDAEYRAIKQSQLKAPTPEAPAKGTKGQTLLLGND